MIVAAFGRIPRRSRSSRISFFVRLRISCPLYGMPPDGRIGADGVGPISKSHALTLKALTLKAALAKEAVSSSPQVARRAGAVHGRRINFLDIDSSGGRDVRRRGEIINLLRRSLDVDDEIAPFGTRCI